MSKQYHNILIKCLMFISGETINIEEAIAAHLSPYKMKTNCIHCFRKTGSSVFPSPVNRFDTLKTRNKTYKNKNFSIVSLFVFWWLLKYLFKVNHASVHTTAYTRQWKDTIGWKLEQISLIFFTRKIMLYININANIKTFEIF